MLNYKELKELDKKTLSKKVDEFKTNLFNLNLKKITTGLEKTSELKKTKRDIARLLTAFNAKKWDKNDN